MFRPTPAGRHGDQRSFPSQNPDFHQQKPESRGSHLPCQHQHPCVMFNPVGGMSSNPVFIHPAATFMGCCRNPSGDHKETQWNRPTTTGFPPNHDAAMRFPASMSGDPDTDANISLAAKQLKAQVDEFIRVYDGFYRLYEKEVAKIKPYVDDDILQRAWSKKIEHNEKFNTGRGQEHKQLSTQRKMLAACLTQIDGATRGSTESQALDDPFRYDRRSIYLEKIRAAGQRVLRLADMTMSSRSACEDLRSELLDLGKLVDPKSNDAKILYQFDRRETLNTQGNSQEVTFNEDSGDPVDDQPSDEGGNDVQDDNTANVQNDPPAQTGW